MVKIVYILIGLILLVDFKSAKAAPDKLHHLSLQTSALAPNAGGQDVYGLKYTRSAWEFGIFRNEYIIAGDQPLTGGTAGYRFDVCDKNCWWRMYLVGSVGGSSGGPVAELTWGSMIPIFPVWLKGSPWRWYPQLRIDFTSQFIGSRDPQRGVRVVTWNMPFWIGLSVPF